MQKKAITGMFTSRSAKPFFVVSQAGFHSSKPVNVEVSKRGDL